MKQVISDAGTLMIQGVLSWVAVMALMWGVYATGTAPNFGGIAGFVELAAWFAASAFVGVSIAGALMWLANFAFFWVQVAKHGYPTENVPENTD